MKVCRLCNNSNLKRYSVLGLYECVNCNFVQRFDDYSPINNTIKQETFRKTSPLDEKINSEFDLPPIIKPSFHVYQEDSRRINKFMGNFIEKRFHDKEIIDFIDVGSGVGYMGFNLKNAIPNLNIHLMEISKEKMDLGIKTFKPDLDKFSFHNDYLDESFVNRNLDSFDISFSFHVLEHVEKILEFVRRLYDITKPGGFMILEVPNQDDDLKKISSEYDELIHFPSHVSNFTKDTLSLLLDRSGLMNVEVEFLPIQRYGFFNYIDWIRFGEKDKVLTDDYVPRDKMSWIEKMWLDHKQENFSTDSLMMIVKK